MIISMWEGNGVGLQWSNISKTASPDDSLTIELVILMFLVDTAIYLLITWYVEAVFPGEYGIPLPWNFPFKKSYWFGISAKDSGLQFENPNYGADGSYDMESSKKNYFENEPNGIKCGIKIANLSKSFAKNKFAVNNLNLSAFDGQITALLGHNGAGIVYFVIIF